MAVLLAEGVSHLATAFNALERDSGTPPRGHRGRRRRGEIAARSGADLSPGRRRSAGVTDIRVVVARREFYRRISAISDDIVSVADRIWYSRVKES